MKLDHNDRTPLGPSFFIAAFGMLIISVSLVTSYEPPLRSNVEHTCNTPRC